MLNTIYIQEITSQQMDLYQAFLKIGLSNDENNFRISLNDELNAPFPTHNKADSFTLGAYETNELLGVVSFERDGSIREKLRHKGILFRMYVSPSHRSKGIARMLIESLIQRVKKLENIEQINLTVIASNTNAKTLYEKMGFVSFASEKNAIKWKGKYFTEDSMVLNLV